MKEWLVYILLCNNDKLYTGITNDMTKRYSNHLHGIGAKFTKVNRPIKIVYTEKCDTRSIASKRECAIKKLTHKQKLNIGIKYNGKYY